jgi:PAS domain S-box-containing protein
LLAGTSYQISIIDAAGLLIFSSNDPHPQPLDLSDREHFKVHRDSRGADRLFISRPVKGRLSGKWSIQLTRPIMEQGQFRGVIVISVKPENLVQFHQKINLGQDAVVAIIRDGGDIMARNLEMDQYIGKIIDTAPYGLPDAPLRGNFRRKPQVDGIERIIGYMRLPEYGVTVIVGAATDQALSAIRSRNLSLVIVSMALTLALAALAWLTRHRAGIWELLQAERDREHQRTTELNRDFVSLLENTSDFIYFKDHESRFRFCSQTLAEITGHADWRQMIGKHDRDVFPPDTAKVYEDEEVPVFQGGKALIGKVDPYYDRHGRHGWVSTNKWPVFAPDGKTVIGLFGISRDITKQVHAEAEFKRSNEELQRFAYVISHDLQEPLRMVASYTTLLGRQYKGRLDAQADEFISFAVDGAKRMQRMIADLLEYSRIHTSTAELEELPLDVAVDQALENLQLTIEENGAVITRDPMPQVRGDQVQLMRLFQNLIGNALKYRADGRAPHIHIGCRGVDDHWELWVSDNGIGIEPEYFQRIFEVFQRLHGREKYSGNGIGLAICRRIVERHGGRIWVESAPEKGSTFSFTLPKISLAA